ncbi:Pentatricopeptide repeat-containing protein, partial [Durusdinium trenchii]
QVRFQALLAALDLSSAPGTIALGNMVLTYWEKWNMVWLAANFYIHFGWEMSLLGFFDYAEWKNGFKPWNFLCATFSSYGNYDRRYKLKPPADYQGTKASIDKVVLAVEVPAGIVDGALCLLWLKGILDNAWYRWPTQLVVSALHAFGTVVFWADELIIIFQFARQILRDKCVALGVEIHGPPVGPAPTQFTWRFKEAEEDKRLRTVHIAGLAKEATEEDVRPLCESWCALQCRPSMPFVPISSRKPHALLLDHDKDRIRAQMQSKDEASVAEHYGLAPSSRGYRFGNHPMTRGPVRGPEVPFKEATRHWKPSEVEREGPMAKVDVKQAKVGAYWDGSHVKLAALRNCQSSPALQQSAAEVMQACHPLTTELRRWEKLAKVTERGEINEAEQRNAQQNHLWIQSRGTLSRGEKATSSRLEAIAIRLEAIANSSKVLGQVSFCFWFRDVASK